MTGTVLYRRTQISWPTIVPLLVVAMILAPALDSAQFVAGPWIVAVVYGVVLLLFVTMRVTVTSDGLEVAFGIGVVRKSVPFADVVSFARVRNRWFHGWGIHKYPGGTLYNASGLSAVEFKLSTGRFVSIGTPDPGALVSALQEATGKAEAAHDTERPGRAWSAQHTVGVVVGACALMLAGSAIYSGLQPPNTIVGFDAFYVSNGFYRNTIPYASMTSLTLETTLPRIGLKMNGFNAGNTLRGNFRLAEWGVGRLFINRDRPPFIVIRTADGFVVVNFSEPEQTQALYRSLKTHMSGSAR